MQLFRFHTKHFLMVVLFLGLHTTNVAQPFKYLVFFKDKVGTNFSVGQPEAFLSESAINRRVRQGISITERDLPVSQLYLDSLKSVGAKINYTTKWLNGALVEVESEAIADSFAQFSFIRKHNFNLGTLGLNEKEGIDAISIENSLKEDVAFYGNSFNQLDMLGIPAMHQAGFTGEGIKIAVIDGGFRNADQLPVFDSLQIKEKLLATYDFVENESNVFDDHDHGTKVFSVIGANLPESLIGVAYDAEFVLLRSEEVASESRIEEFYWLKAAEFADSIGVDIINASLGYNIFDDVIDNYSQNDLDGETALITVAADLAAATGMLVVASAGNEGNDSWGTITPPADADSILAVGAVTALQNYAGFSSIGPTADGRVKPDVVAQGSSVTVSSSTGNITFSSGTSFAAPLITGLAAGIWQANPDLTNMQLIDTIRSIASQSEQADNQIGFGIPDFKKLLEVTGIDDINNFDIGVFPNPAENNFDILFPENMEGENFEISLFDTSGKLVVNRQEKVKQARINMDTQQLKGLFILKIVGNRGAAFTKIISK